MTVYNFSAGPACLPKAVLEKVQAELLDWRGSGMSVMEMSHRGAEFALIAAEAKQHLADLLDLPAGYRILYLHGGARSQFSMVPMNLLTQNKKANYLLSGLWGEKACEEAQKFGDINCVPILTDVAPYAFTTPETWPLDPEACYTHVTTNETINGNENYDIPSLLPGQRLVSDMSSTLLSRPFAVSDYDLIYACAQKNMGPAGVTFVILKEAIIDEPIPGTPAMFNYTNHLQDDSLYNTAPTFPLYVAAEVFKWLKQQGGLPAMQKRNQTQAERLYCYIDDSDFYSNPVAESARSWMNIPFHLAVQSKEALFLENAKAAGLVGLKGHRYVGGLRASIYNAMPDAGIDGLLNFMEDFAKVYKQNGGSVGVSSKI